MLKKNPHQHKTTAERERAKKLNGKCDALNIKIYSVYDGYTYEANLFHMNDTQALILTVFYILSAMLLSDMNTQLEIQDKTESSRMGWMGNMEVIHKEQNNTIT